VTLAACGRCGSKIPEKLGTCPRCLLEADVEPAVLGGAFELEEPIGRGGMGTVWRAKHLKLGRTVAVKLLPEDLAASPEFRARFEREARVLAMLDHPHIVTVHDFGQDGDQSWIVMEHVKGEPLSKAMPLPIARSVEVMLQVSDALAYAHARGVVHRDVKPANILFDTRGRAKVSDFGIARIIAPDARGWTVTRTDEAIGTIGYLAPEALKGALPDPRMDVYSLGVLFYELLTGHLPAGAFDPPPAPLDKVVLRALAQDPAKRFADAGEMHRELTRVAAELDTAARGVTAPLAVAPATAAPASSNPAPASAPSAVSREAPTAPATGPLRLEAEERVWLRATALLLSVATAVLLLAFVQSVTPKIVTERNPLIEIDVTKLPDGRLVSRARFETIPTLGALAAIVVAMVGYGILTLHWRREGLMANLPDRPVPESRIVLKIGIASILLYGFHWGLRAVSAPDWMTRYIVLPGGALEVAALFFLWMAMLEAWRTHRSVTREYALWGGFWLAVVAPAIELLLHISRWTPEAP
jgi:serine/threonine-protein kinase